MELVKNIFFNTDKLTAHSTVKISYTGKFFQDGSEKTFIHYGFGNSWEGLSDIEMQKTDLGFQAEVELLDMDTFNFCFKNEKDEWDNNDCQNYIFNIEIPETSLITLTESSLISPRRLRRSYLISKKIRITVYKLLIYIPKLLTGNYKRKNRTQN